MERQPETVGGVRSPERRPAYVRRNFYLLSACLLLLLVLTGVEGYRLVWEGGTGQASKGGGLHGALRRELAAKLLSVGLKEKAVEQYGLYLAESDLPPDRAAKLTYTLGKLCMEEGRYEDALGWLYQVEMLDPKSEVAADTGARIVTCLERLGRFAQAQYSLDARSAPGGKKRGRTAGDRVVAKIGNETITLAELNEAYAALPEWMRPSKGTGGPTEDFLRQYVAETLLYRKAKRLAMDKDPEVRKGVEQALRRLMIQRLLEDEVKEKVKVSDDEAELYYQAHRDRYRRKEAFRIRLLRTDEGHLDAVRKALADGEAFASVVKRYSLDPETREKGGEIREWIEEGLDPTGMGDPEALWRALAGHGEGEVTGPVHRDGEVYFFEILAHRPPSPIGFEEAEKQVRADLYRERVAKAYQELIRQSLEASEVKLFPEALQAQASPAGGKSE